jgi:hypothetical protein
MPTCMAPFAVNDFRAAAFVMNDSACSAPTILVLKFAVSAVRQLGTVRISNEVTHMRWYKRHAQAQLLLLLHWPTCVACNYCCVAAVSAAE